VTGFRVEGLDDLRAALRALPADLAASAGPLVEAAGDAAAADVRAAYGAVRGTGNLADHVRVERTAGGRFGVAVRVVSGARHAALYEFGTETRRTRRGWSRGRMPPAHVFIPALSRRRRGLWASLAELVRAAGLEVR